MQTRSDSVDGRLPAGRSRPEETLRQREEHGRRSLAFLPIHYPKEMQGGQE